ncbi:MAG: glycosyltransferase [Clostridia bacterium]|nr:glycosyltransferase [Clostridia bacterium]
MEIKISVIVPVYNMEQYLRECLDSILGQTLREIEVVVINDGSTDGSLTILREYEKKDGRVRVIDKPNEGVGKARNDGLKAAAGEFVAFMDSDDYYPNDTVLETLYRAVKDSGVRIAGGRKNRLLTDGTVEKDTFAVEDCGLRFDASGLTEYAAYQYDYGYTQYVFDREMLQQNGIFFPAYKRFQDPPFFVRAMIAAGRFYVADCESYCYRMVPNEGKYSVKSTVDFLCGLTDNLNVSRQNGLAKLHYLSAMRLDREGSFMAIRNLYDPDRAQILSRIIRATALVDCDWLKAEGYALPEPFVPEVFEYAAATAEKYEKLRQNKAVKAARKIIGR